MTSLPPQGARTNPPVGRVRVASVEDCPQIGQIHVEGWRAAYRGIVPDRFLAGLSAEKRAAGWKYAIEKDPRGVFVFERAGHMVGWAAVGRSREAIPDAGEIFALYVDPAAWRQGCGQQLMAAVESELGERGCRTLVLWVLENNFPARAFYERLGYANDGARKTEHIEEVSLIEMRMARELSAGHVHD